MVKRAIMERRWLALAVLWLTVAVWLAAAFILGMAAG